jgi:hypothetical protein
VITLTGINCSNFLLLSEFTKVLVVGGRDDRFDYHRSVEVLDLKSSTTTCKIVADFPFPSTQQMGGLGFQNKPLVCGGWNRTASNKCYSLESTVWTPSASLNYARRSEGGYSAFPSQNQSRSFFVIGGYNLNGSLYNAEALTERGWEVVSTSLPRLFGPICQVVLNSTTALVIYSNQVTYYYNTISNSWIQGPSITEQRIQGCSCGLIKKDSNSQEMSVIVAGGSDYSSLFRSVELLDIGSSTWRRGPDMPSRLVYAQMVEGPDGGVVIVGGLKDQWMGWLSTSLISLPHGGAGAAWTTMTQQLKVGRANHVAFLVPDDYC